jgi:hypothetical protein
MILHNPYSLIIFCKGRYSSFNKMASSLREPSQDEHQHVYLPSPSSEDAHIHTQSSQADDSPNPDVHMMTDNEGDIDTVSDITKFRVIIGIDFGTTFSCVAYIVLPIGVEPRSVRLEDIKCIGSWPGYQGISTYSNVRFDVPTELWYEQEPIRKRKRPATDIDPSSRQVCDPERHDDLEIVNDDNGGNDGDGDDDDSEPPADASLVFTNKRTILYCGHEVTVRLNTLHKHRDDARPLTRMKLSLNPGEKTEQHRKDHARTLSKLVEKGMLKDKADVIMNYFRYLLEHTKKHLKRSNQLQEDVRVQYVLTVPPNWPMLSSRILQNSVENAASEVGISKQDRNRAPDVFIVSESEATAEWNLKCSGKDLFVSTWENLTVVSLTYF